MYVYLPPCPCGTKWSVLGCQLVNCFWICETGPLRTRETGPLGAGETRDPPLGLLLSCRVALDFFGHFFLHRLETPIFPMLVPTWFQLGHNLVPKKSFQEGSKSQPKLHLGLDALSDRFLIDLGCHFQGFCDVGQISYKRQLDPQNCHLGSNLVPTWVDVGRVFGFQVGAKLALNGIKTPRNKQSKKGLLLEGLKIDVCRFLGTTWGVQGAPRATHEARPQDTLQDRFVEQFWMIFINFLMLFHRFFIDLGLMWVHFLFIFCSFVCGWNISTTRCCWWC